MTLFPRANSDTNYHISQVPIQTMTYLNQNEIIFKGFTYTGTNHKGTDGKKELQWMCRLLGPAIVALSPSVGPKGPRKWDRVKQNRDHLDRSSDLLLRDSQVRETTPQRPSRAAHGCDPAKSQGAWKHVNSNSKDDFSRCKVVRKNTKRWGTLSHHGSRLPHLVPIDHPSRVE